MSLAADDGEVLEDGRRAGTPPGDNLLLDFVRAEARAYHDLLVPLGARVVDEPDIGVLVVDAGSPSPFGNVAMLHRPVPDGRADELASHLHATFAGTEGGPYLLFSPWPLADLTPLGFTPVGHPPLMARASGGTPPEVEGVVVREVVDAAGLADLERTLVEAYPVDELLPWEAGSYLRPEVLGGRWRLFLASDDTGPLATAGAYVADGLTVVELVSTRPEARRRGIGAAITAAATLAVPSQPAALIASDDGRGAYERLGYLTLLRYTLWLGTRAPTA